MTNSIYANSVMGGHSFTGKTDMGLTSNKQSSDKFASLMQGHDGKGRMEGGRGHGGMQGNYGMGGGHDMSGKGGMGGGQDMWGKGGMKGGMGGGHDMSGKGGMKGGMGGGQDMWGKGGMGGGHDMSGKGGMGAFSGNMPTGAWCGTDTSTQLGIDPSYVSVNNAPLGSNMPIAMPNGVIGKFD